MKLIDYRTKYNEDYTVKTEIDSRGKKHYKYVYRGIWYRWGVDGFDLGRRRLEYILLELVSAALFIYAGYFCRAPLMMGKAVSGFGLLSVLPWLVVSARAQQFSTSVVQSRA